MGEIRVGDGNGENEEVERWSGRPKECMKGVAGVGRQGGSGGDLHI